MWPSTTLGKSWDDCSSTSPTWCPFPAQLRLSGDGADDEGMTPDDVRALALALPDTVELPHHQRTSFRVHGQIFATMDDLGVNVMLDEEPARAAATDDGVELLWWGRKLSGVRIPLTDADGTVVAELLDEAWQQRRRRS